VYDAQNRLKRNGNVVRLLRGIGILAALLVLDSPAYEEGYVLFERKKKDIVSSIVGRVGSR
jgi:hypothetical protein